MHAVENFHKKDDGKRTAMQPHNLFGDDKKQAATRLHEVLLLKRDGCQSCPTRTPPKPQKVS